MSKNPILKIYFILFAISSIFIFSSIIFAAARPSFEVCNDCAPQVSNVMIMNSETGMEPAEFSVGTMARIYARIEDSSGIIYARALIKDDSSQIVSSFNLYDNGSDMHGDNLSFINSPTEGANDKIFANFWFIPWTLDVSKRYSLIIEASDPFNNVYNSETDIIQNPNSYEVEFDITNICNPDCALENEQQCASNRIQTCLPDSEGCLNWKTTNNCSVAGTACCGSGASITCCQANEICSAGSCVCPDFDSDGHSRQLCGGTDCDDNNSQKYPGNTEICDGIDNDCDSATADGSGESAPLNDNQEGVCFGARKICSGTLGWINDYSSIPNNEYPTETSCDGLDNNCDGEIDENCECLGSETSICGSDTGECQSGTKTCAGGIWGSCVGEIAPIAEICDNSKDDDCDGTTDEGCDDPPDTVKPIVASFSINPATVNTDQTITISWTATDNEALKQAELWRTTDGGGVPNINNWTKIKADAASGTLASGSFTDSIPTAGKYWYGIHVVDEAGNIGTEPNPAIVTVNIICYDNDNDGYDNCAIGEPNGDSKTTDCNDNNSDINPGKDEICDNSKDDDCDGRTDCIDSDCANDSACAAADITAPKVTSFNINPTTVNTNSPITASYTVTDNTALKQAELWRTTDSGGVPNNSNWTKIKTNLVSGTSASGSFTDSISAAGTYWYGLHVVDQADPGNIGYEPSRVRVVVGEGASAENKFTNTFLWMVSADWTMQEVIDSHKYDLLAVQGFKWNSVNDDTWGELRKLNPDVKIFSYYQSRIKDDEDHKVNPYKSTMGRWNISRGHSLGNCNTDNPDMFLYNIHGDRVNGATIHNFVPDWSNPKFIKYWIEAWRTDNLGRPWQSDGVFIDEVQLLASDSGATTNPVGINWTPALINWINKVTKAMTEHDTLVWLNSGTVKDQKGIDAYVELDNNLENLVYFAASEGSYVVGWGSGDCQFFSEKVWLKQVEVSNQIHRINYGMQSFVRHKLGDNVGVDNWGKPVTVKDALWYGLCSYHLSKNTADNNTFFSFNAKIYSASEYYDEYDINLGNAVDTFKVTNIGGNNIYYREFEKGYVYVNPTTNNVNNIALPETCKQLTYTNFKNNPSTISDTNTINLVSHRGTFLLKSDGGDALDTTLPEVTLFTINPTTANTNQTIIASYAVTDNKELKQVELWRTTDSGGVPNASNWTKIKINSVSGTSASGSFTDSISTAGTYWYGLHVVDNANPGNIGYEPSSVKVVVNSVVLEIPPVPTIPSFPDIQSNGNTYHVDKDIGSNSNNGSSGSPWATIQYGVDQLSAGDTLIVHEGATAYAEEVDISVAGSSDNWITIQGKSGQAVEITHSSGIGVELTSAAKYIYIENFKVTTIGGGRGTRCNSGSAYIAYDNMEFDGTGNGIDGLILGINLTLPGVKYVYVRNVEIHHYNGYGTLLNKPGEKFYFYNCVAHHNGDDGFAGRSNRCASHHLTDIYFTDCYSHDNTGEGWDIGAKYGQNILKNCVSSNNNTFGFKIWGNSTWFVNCLSYGNENGDMNLKSLWTTPGYDVSNVYILNCTFHGQHASHSGNIIGQKENNSGASCGIEQMVDTELYLYNNIFWATNRTILFWHTNYSVAEADHNYFFAAGNIVSYQYRQNYSTVLKTYYISDMNNNVFFNAKGLEANSFARWTSEHGLSDPGFVNLVGDDYKLIGTSFAVDAGKNVGVNYDILGAQRPQGLGYDIGAYEYIQTDATSP